MTTVSDLNSCVATALEADPSVVSQHSRALINAGLLPKSRGRAVAEVSVRDAIKVVIAVGMKCKYNETASLVENYCDLLPDGMPESAPDSIKERMVDRLAYTFLATISPVELTPEERRGHRKAERDLEYEFVLDYPHVLVRSSDGQFDSDFKSGGIPGHFKKAARHSFHLNCSAFDEFADLKFGLDEAFWRDFWETGEVPSDA